MWDPGHQNFEASVPKGHQNMNVFVGPWGGVISVSVRNQQIQETKNKMNTNKQNENKEIK